MAYPSKVYDVITNKIKELLNKGVVPWHKPWNSDQGMPRNLVTKFPYRGVNVFLLNAMPYNSPYWVTYKQVKKLGGTIKNSEIKNTMPVVFFKWLDHNDKRKTSEFEDEENNEILISEPYTRNKQKFPVVRYFRVYNLEQCLGLEKYIPAIKKNKELQPIMDCETLVNNMPDRPIINYGGDVAYYSPNFDTIQMPSINYFFDIESFHSTKFHELIHSTGHKKRLDRKGIVDLHAFGDPVYSLEELVAEMGAAYLCGMVGIENKTVNNSASYIANWLKALNNDQKMVIMAGAQAQKACDYIFGKKKEMK